MEPDNRVPDAVAALWQGQPTQAHVPTPADVERMSQRFARRIARRNLVEYAAGLLVCLVFGYYLVLFPDALIRTGCGLLMAGTLLAMRTLARSGRSRMAPADLAVQPCLAFHRAELERQRDLLSSVWSWYLAPLVPGLLVFLLGLYLWTRALPHARQHEGLLALTFLLCLTVIVAVFLAVGALNRSVARRLQTEIDALDRLGREPE